MDIDEWEFLSDDGFIDFNEFDDGENKKKTESKSVFDDNYFCTSPKSRNHHQMVVPNQLVHVPIQLEPRIGNAPDDVLVEENTKDHVGAMITMVPSTTTDDKIKVSNVVEEADQDTVSHFFFKIKENDQFVDMKMDSPKSSSRGILFPPIDAGELRFEEKGEAMEIMNSPRMKVEKEMLVMECDKEAAEDSSDGFNLWKWGLTGIGAICSFGVAAATICVLFYGSQHRNKLRQHHKIRFQISTDDKRINQVVHHATKLNEAISAARGVPLSRAHITYGGYYYDGI